MPGNNWMGKYLRDDDTLTQIIMPGSHDAGVFADGDTHAGKLGHSASAICQSGGLTHQLEQGSRLFDLRARLCRAQNSINAHQPVSRSVETTDGETLSKGKDVNRGRVRFYHGGKKMGTKGGDVDTQLREVRSFLEKNKTEFCILRFSKSKAVPHALVNLVLEILGGEDGQPSILYSGTGNLAKAKYVNLKGKAIAVFDSTFPATNQSLGIHRYVKNEKCDVGLGIAGSYSASPFTSTVLSKQKEKLQKAPSGVTDRLYAWYQTQTYVPNIKFATKHGVGSEQRIRDMYHALLYNADYDKINVVMMDFVDNFKCRAVYRRNHYRENIVALRERYQHQQQMLERQLMERLQEAGLV